MNKQETIVRRAVVADTHSKTLTADDCTDHNPSVVEQSNQTSTTKYVEQEGLPVSWHACLGVLAFIGTVLLVSSTQHFAAKFRVFGYDPLRLSGIYLIAVPIIHWTISRILRCTSGLFDLLPFNQLRRNLWPPALIGGLESIMYPTAILANHPETIMAWMVLKYAPQWGRWNVDPKNDRHSAEADERIHEGRRRYYQSLFGTALMFLLSGATYLILKLSGAAPPFSR